MKSAGSCSRRSVESMPPIRPISASSLRHCASSRTTRVAARALLMAVGALALELLALARILDPLEHELVPAVGGKLRGELRGVVLALEHQLERGGGIAGRRAGRAGPASRSGARARPTARRSEAPATGSGPPRRRRRSGRAPDRPRGSGPSRPPPAGRPRRARCPGCAARPRAAPAASAGRIASAVARSARQLRNEERAAHATVSEPSRAAGC